MKVNGIHYRSIWYDHELSKVKIIDQRWLPHVSCSILILTLGVEVARGTVAPSLWRISGFGFRVPGFGLGFRL